MSTKIKKSWCLILLLFSVILLVFFTIELIDNMVSYKYLFEDIEDNDKTNRILSYQLRKEEVEILLGNLITMSIYVFFIIGWFSIQYKKTKIRYYLVFSIASVLLFIINNIALIQYLIEYNQSIETSVSYLVYSVKSLKTENVLIDLFLKIYIIYLIVVMIHLLTVILNKQKNKVGNVSDLALHRQ